MQTIIYGESVIKTTLSAHYDKENEILHLMDKNISGDRSVTNVLYSGEEKTFLEQIKKDLGINKEPKTIYTYTTDGLVQEYKEGVYKVIKEIKIKRNGYKPFVKEMEKRKKN